METRRRHCHCACAVSNGIPMLSDGKTAAMEDQIEAKETKILEFEKEST